jgi:hypothetical protein
MVVRGREHSASAPVRAPGPGALAAAEIYDFSGNEIDASEVNFLAFTAPGP